MTVPVTVAIVALTCMLVISIRLNVALFTQAQAANVQRGGEAQAFAGLAAQSSADQVKQLQSMQSAHMKQMHQLATSNMEQLRLTLAQNSDQLREAVKVAWMPNSQLQGANSKSVAENGAWLLPTPLAADDRLYDDSDPTDSLLSESGLGRHDGAVMANDDELIKDGNYLGIPGLVPPPGVVDDQARRMLIHQAEQLQSGGMLGGQMLGGQMLGAQPSGGTFPGSVPPGNFPTPQLDSRFTPVGGF